MEKQSSDSPVCPKCNSTNVAKYLWGLRMLSDELLRDIEEGRVILNCLPFLMSKKWEAFHPCWDGDFFFAVLLPFTCDFAIYSPHFKTAKYGAVFGGMGVRIYSK